MVMTMSSYFRVWCDWCKEWGPEIMRTAGGTQLLTVNDPFEWSRFLIKHQDHAWLEGDGVRLVSEDDGRYYRRPRPEPRDEPDDDDD